MVARAGGRWWPGRAADGGQGRRPMVTRARSMVSIVSMPCELVLCRWQRSRQHTSPTAPPPRPPHTSHHQPLLCCEP
eukprot:255692-Chlamydomonas_euryale.AAC.1